MEKLCRDTVKINETTSDLTEKIHQDPKDPRREQNGVSKKRCIQVMLNETLKTKEKSAFPCLVGRS